MERILPDFAPCLPTPTLIHLVKRIAEKYLDRGILFRALDHEWGGSKAIEASASLFAIYHPPESWLPVFVIGGFNTWLFKVGKQLLPCIIVHAIYNIIIVMTI